MAKQPYGANLGPAAQAYLKSLDLTPTAPKTFKATLPSVKTPTIKKYGTIKQGTASKSNSNIVFGSKSATNSVFDGGSSHTGLYGNLPTMTPQQAAWLEHEKNASKGHESYLGKGLQIAGDAGGGVLSKGLDLLGRPAEAVAGFAYGLENRGDPVVKPDFGEAFSDAWHEIQGEGVVGKGKHKTDSTWWDVLRNPKEKDSILGQASRSKNPWVHRATHVLAGTEDVLTDPLNLIGGAGVWTKVGETGFRVIKGLNDLDKATEFVSGAAKGSKALREAHSAERLDAYVKGAAAAKEVAPEAAPALEAHARALIQKGYRTITPAEERELATLSRAVQDEAKAGMNRYLGLRLGWGRNALTISTGIKTGRTELARIAAREEGNILSRNLAKAAGTFKPGYFNAVAHGAEITAKHQAERMTTASLRRATSVLGKQFKDVPLDEQKTALAVASETPGVLGHGRQLNHQLLKAALAHEGIKDVERAAKFVEGWHEVMEHLRVNEAEGGVQFKHGIHEDTVYVPHMFKRDVAGVFSRGGHGKAGFAEKAQTMTYAAALRASRMGHYTTNSHLVDSPAEILLRRITSGSKEMADANLRNTMRKLYGVAERKPLQGVERMKMFGRVNKARQGMVDLGRRIDNAKTQHELNKLKAGKVRAQGKRLHAARMQARKEAHKLKTDVLKAEHAELERKAAGKVLTKATMKDTVEKLAHRHGVEIKYISEGAPGRNIDHLLEMDPEDMTDAQLADFMEHAFGEPNLEDAHAIHEPQYDPNTHTIYINPIKSRADYMTALHELGHAAQYADRHPGRGVLKWLNKVDSPTEAEYILEHEADAWHYALKELKKRGHGITQDELDMIRKDPEWAYGTYHGALSHDARVGPQQAKLHAHGPSDEVPLTEKERGMFRSQATQKKQQLERHLAKDVEGDAAKATAKNDARLDAQYQDALAKSGIEKETLLTEPKAQLARLQSKIDQLDDAAHMASNPKIKGFGEKMGGTHARLESLSMPIRNSAGKEIGQTHFWVPKEIHAQVAAVERVTVDPKFAEGLATSLAKALHIWKASVTVINPGYRVRNTVSDLWNMYVSGVPGYMIPVYVGKAVKFQRTLSVAEAKIAEHGEKAVLTDGERKALALGHQMYDHGILSGQFQGDLEIASKQMIGGKPVYKKGYDALMTGQRNAENNTRVAHMLYRLEARHEPLAVAAEHVRTAHFDYEDLTSAERAIKSTLIPFYTWSRKNIPYQIKMIGENPSKFVNALLVQKNIENGSGAKPSDVIGNALDNYPTAFRIGPGYLNPQTGLQDLANLGHPDKEAGMLNPAIQVGLEALTGHQIGTGDAISGPDASHQETPAPGLLASILKPLGLGGTTSRMGPDGNPMYSPGVNNWVAYGLQQTPWTNALLSSNAVNSANKKEFEIAGVPVTQGQLSQFTGVGYIRPNEVQQRIYAQIANQKAEAAYFKQLRDEGLMAPAAQPSNNTPYQFNLNKYLNKQLTR